VTLLSQAGQYLNAPTRQLDRSDLAVVGAVIGLVIAVVGLIGQTLFGGRGRDRW
jgi:uncharacterized protein YcfJ